MKTKSTCIIFLLTFIQLSFIYGQSAYSTDPNGMMIYNSNGSTPIDNSALVEVRSSTKGMLPPRMTTTQINNVNSPAIGLMIYDTDLKCLKTYNGLVWECTGADVMASTPLSSSFAYKAVGDNSVVSESIVADNLGNTVSVGEFRGAVTFGNPNSSMTLTSFGDYDGFIVKHDNNGNLLWATQIGGGAGDQQILDVAMDSFGNVAVTGFLRYATNFYSTNGSVSLYSNNGYYSKIFVAKYNSSGVLIWFKVMSSSGNLDCYGRGVCFDSGGNILSTGGFRGIVAFDGTSLTSISNTEDVFIAKFNSVNGNIQWVRTAGGVSNIEAGHELVCDASNNVYVLGFYGNTVSFGESPNTVSYTSRGNTDLFIAKYSSSGAFIWAKTAGSTVEEEMGGIAYSAIANAIYICGSYKNTLTFGPGLGTNPLATVGSTSYFNGFLAKYDLNGNITWSVRQGCSSNEHNYNNDVDVDSNGNPHVLGIMQYNTNIYSSNSNTPYTYLRGVQYEEPLLMKYSAAGSLLWAICAVDGYGELARGISLKNDVAYSFGNFRETLNFGYQQLTSTNNGYSGDLFIWRYKE